MQQNIKDALKLQTKQEKEKIRKTEELIIEVKDGCHTEEEEDKEKVEEEEGIDMLEVECLDELKQANEDEPSGAQSVPDVEESKEQAFEWIDVDEGQECEAFIPMDKVAEPEN